MEKWKASLGKLAPASSRQQRASADEPTQEARGTRQKKARLSSTFDEVCHRIHTGHVVDTMLSHDLHTCGTHQPVSLSLSLLRVRLRAYICSRRQNRASTHSRISIFLSRVSRSRAFLARLDNCLLGLFGLCGRATIQPKWRWTKTGRKMDQIGYIVGRIGYFLTLVEALRCTLRFGGIFRVCYHSPLFYSFPPCFDLEVVGRGGFFLASRVEITLER